MISLGIGILLFLGAIGGLQLTDKIMTEADRPKPPVVWADEDRGRAIRRELW